MPERIGDKESSVVRVLPDMEPFPIELWLVAHRELRTSRRIRRVFDVLFNELSD
jgi:DNA-binding transcriptional LysR family regulator